MSEPKVKVTREESRKVHKVTPEQLRKLREARRHAEEMVRLVTEVKGDFSRALHSKEISHAEWCGLMDLAHIGDFAGILAEGRLLPRLIVEA